MEEERRPLIIMDAREREILRNIDHAQAEVKEQQLEVGDAILSNRVGVERKRIQDFLQSIVDQRIFRQMENLSSSFECPLLILEGNPETLFMERNIHENTIRGVLSAIAIDYKVPIIWTQNSRETAKQLLWMAKREQILGKRGIQVRPSRKTSTLKDQQEFLVAGLPGINSKRARKLLLHFRTPEKVFRATEKQLDSVDGFGEKTIQRMKNILKGQYTD